MSSRWPALCAVAALAAGCASVPRPPVERQAKAPPAAAIPSTPPSPSTPAPQRRGGYYLDDGPGDDTPADLNKLPDAEPKAEPLHRFANNPYTVFGKEYVPDRNVRPFRQRGIASWYGRRFHGQPTSSGEPYDMYAMTAAHPTLPIPSYARVTNLANNRSVIVRINDRGPFLHGRVIDLSYAAAWKLGYVDNGSASVEVESILPERAQAAGAAQPRSAAESAKPQSDGVPVAMESNGVYLQLAAFSAREHAENLRARLTLELSWLTRPVAVSTRDGLFRLRIGPFDDRAEAALAAQRIREALDVAPVMVR